MKAEGWGFPAPPPPRHRRKATICISFFPIWKLTDSSMISIVFSFSIRVVRVHMETLADLVHLGSRYLTFLFKTILHFCVSLKKKDRIYHLKSLNTYDDNDNEVIQWFFVSMWNQPAESMCYHCDLTGEQKVSSTPRGLKWFIRAPGKDVMGWKGRTSNKSV